VSSFLQDLQTDIKDGAELDPSFQQSNKNFNLAASRTGSAKNVVVICPQIGLATTVFGWAGCGYERDGIK
jgi:hypothetical protein